MEGNGCKMEIRLREKIKGYGHPVLSEDELGRFRGLEKDARVIGFKKITADLEKRSVGFDFYDWDGKFSSILKGKK